MIFYFSGTGNSRFAAERIARALEDDVVSINDNMKKGGTRSFSSEKPLVFVVPTYAWRIPNVVTRWISEACFEGNQDAYFVLTCGGSVGNAHAYAKKLCVKVGLRFRGLAQVVMPENYVALYDVPDEKTCQILIEQAKPQIDQVATLIKDGSSLPEVPVDIKGRFRSGPENVLFYPLLVNDKAFAVTDACTSCDLCVQRCPLNNIILKDGRPVWQGDCTHCMACIGGCPVEAIEYGTKSQGRHRYYLNAPA